MALSNADKARLLELENEQLQLEEEDAQTSQAPADEHKTATTVSKLVIPSVMQTAADAANNPAMQPVNPQATKPPSAMEVAGAVAAGQNMGDVMAGQAVSDILMAPLRWGASLFKGTRGKTVDEKTGQERPRTALEAAQNPSGSFTTPIREAVDKTGLPQPVKDVANMGIQAAEGGVAGGIAGAATTGAARLAAPAIEGTGNALQRMGEMVQSAKYGITKTDVKKGASLKNIFRYGLNKMTPSEAYQWMENKFKQIGSYRDQLLGNNPVQVDLYKVAAGVQKKMLSQRFKTQHSTRMQDANDAFGHIMTSWENTLGRGQKPGYLNANALEGNWLKTDLRDATNFTANGGGGFRQGIDPHTTEEVANLFFRGLKNEVDRIGGSEARKISKIYSDLIPLRNVALNRMPAEEAAKLASAQNSATGIITGRPGAIARVATKLLVNPAGNVAHGVGESMQSAGKVARNANVPSGAFEGAVTGLGVGTGTAAMVKLTHELHRVMTDPSIPKSAKLENLWQMLSGLDKEESRKKALVTIAKQMQKENIPLFQKENASPTEADEANPQDTLNAE